VNREILKLALPNILSNLSVPLVSSVDTALMGHLSASHLAALGVSGMMLMFLYGNMGFLRMGTTGMSAQALGARDPREWSLVLYRALLVAGGLSLLLLSTQKMLFELGAWMMEISPDYASLAWDYFHIRIWSAPAVLGILALTGFFFGMQNARYPLYVTLVINSVNLIVSFFLVRSCGWGVEGAAWGSVTAQYFGLILGGWLLLKRCRYARVRVDLFAILDRKGLKRFFHINRNIFFRTVALTLSLLLFYAQAARISETTLTAMIVMMQFVIWMSFAIDGFANAAESLVGRAYGAKNWKRLEQAVTLSLGWGAAVAGAFSLVYGIFGLELAELFTNQHEVLAAVLPLLEWVGWLPIVSFVAFIMDGVFIGMTSVLSMRNSVLLSMGVYLLFSSLLPHYWEPSVALWSSFLLFFFCRGAILFWIYRHHKWRAP